MVDNRATCRRLPAAGRRVASHIPSSPAQNHAALYGRRPQIVASLGNARTVTLVLGIRDARPPKRNIAPDRAASRSASILAEATITADGPDIVEREFPSSAVGWMMAGDQAALADALEKRALAAADRGGSWATGVEPAPEGGFIGLGRSPLSTSRPRRARSMPGIGRAERSAAV